MQRLKSFDVRLLFLMLFDVCAQLHQTKIHILGPVERTLSKRMAESEQNKNKEQHLKQNSAIAMDSLHGACLHAWTILR